MQYQTPHKTNNVFLAELPSGRAGTVATLKLMVRIIKRAKKNYSLRRLSQDIVAGVAGKNWRGEVLAIRDWVRNNIRYTRDIRGMETLAIPEVTLDTRQGDCDDHAILVAVLLEMLGHPTRFVAIALHGQKYIHVFAETKISNNWIPVETTEKWQLGHKIPKVSSRVIIYV